MFTNAQIWLGAISLAREIVKYLRESDRCPKDAKCITKDAAKALKEKDKDAFKAKINEMLD